MMVGETKRGSGADGKEGWHIGIVDGEAMEVYTRLSVQEAVEQEGTAR
jgi:hypothetical protein